MPPDQPGALSRWAASLRAEEPVAPLAAYRRAGATAWELMDAAPTWWAQLLVSGSDPWRQAAQENTQLLCAWNAFVPQLVAEQLLDAESRRRGGRAGFLPAVSAEQARWLFGAVEPWLARSRQAALALAYRVDLEVPLPTSLPPWVEVEPCPTTHLEAVTGATAALRTRVDIALGSLRDLPVTADHAEGHARLLQLVEQATSAADYGAAMLSPDLSPQGHADVEARLKFALSRLHHLGQLCALPALLAGTCGPRRRRHLATPHRRPRTGQPTTPTTTRTATAAGTTASTTEHLA